jgi:signal transduction histidine kinase
MALPGRVWQEGRALWVGQISLEPDFKRREVALKAGLQAGMAFPIQNDGIFFGVLEFFTRRNPGVDEVLLNMMTAIGSEIGQFTQRRNAEEQLRRAHDELEIRVHRRTAELKAANAKLQTAISERKRLENELLEITEKERRRIALDLHDDLGQKLSGIALMTKGLELKLTKIKSDSAQDASRIHTLVQEAMSHASDLAHDLATLDLKNKSLIEALEHLAAHARELFGIRCDFAYSGEVPTLDPGVVMQLYKIAQEALTNAIKHGKSTQVAINLVGDVHNLSLTVQNNGLPFPDLKGHSTGMGLRIMNYRASLIGGAVDITANGAEGTLVHCVVPLEAKK